MKLIFALIGCLLLSGFVSATENDVIKERMASYWKAYSDANFDVAATYVLPSVLEEMKKELLPIFLALTKSSDPELNFIGNAFFKGVPVESRESLTPSGVFVGINGFIAAANAQMFEFLALSSIEITESKIVSPNEAIISYRMIIQGMPTSDIERFVKFENQWYVRLKEPPTDAAFKFRQLFGL